MIALPPVETAEPALFESTMTDAEPVTVELPLPLRLSVASPVGLRTMMPLLTVVRLPRATARAPIEIFSRDPKTVLNPLARFEVMTN
jgi:hypothetical protein